MTESDDDSGDYEEFIFKVIVVGEAGVGKTSIIRRYVENQFSTDYKATVGVDFALKEIKNDGRSMRLQLWDIAGQERFSSMTHVYYKEAAAACIVFDLTDSKTFKRVDRWKNDVEEKVKLENGQTVPMLLLGNKNDMSNKEVNNEEVENYAKQNGFVGFFPVSALSNENLDKAFGTLTSSLLQHDPKPVDPNILKLNIDDDRKKEEPKKSCCK